ncbi:hypothetical protein BDA96_04G094300 [Sorghum bicolor]|uniref:Uncharacterized protein n=1 Tax=Sorghum bicolor TaxID=4558 RepID=A0A921R518_SORBI|nr:hypothetical protein BDA96_04G094300 [Sorghum bicolor]
MEFRYLSVEAILVQFILMMQSRSLQQIDYRDTPHTHCTIEQQRSIVLAASTSSSLCRLSSM